MEKGKIDELAVKNFLDSLDMSMKMVDHFKNALQDAKLYDWSSETFLEIMKGIEDAYNKKEK